MQERGFSSVVPLHDLFACHMSYLKYAVSQLLITISEWEKKHLNDDNAVLLKSLIHHLRDDP